MKGTFLLDIEVELAWGFIDQKFDKKKMAQTARNIRECLNEVLILLERYRIPVTWGIIGHVALEHCERDKVPHAEMPRPSYKWLSRDWYELDPCSRLKEEPAFYGKDIVDHIIDFTSRTRVAHDIACHSFSHQLFGDEGCSEAVAKSEIEQCLRIMKQSYGLQPRVFIFPRDFVGHLDVLKRAGFIAFRGPIPHAISYSETEDDMVNIARKYMSLFSYLGSFYFGLSPPIVDIKQISGLTDIPGSMCFNKKPFIPLSLVTLKAKKGIKRAIEKNGVFHLYTHDVNFGQAPNIQSFVKDFGEILAYASLQREQEKLTITTIRSLAEDGVS